MCKVHYVRDTVALHPSPSFLLVMHIHRYSLSAAAVCPLLPLSSFWVQQVYVPSSLLICITAVYRPGRPSYPNIGQWKDQSLEAVPSLAACGSWALQSKLWLGEGLNLVISSPPRILSWEGADGEASCPLVDICVKTLPEAELLPSFASGFLGLGFHCSLPGHQSVQMSHQQKQSWWNICPQILYS